MPSIGNPDDHEHLAADEDQVYGITTAESSHTQEITRRQKQYILTMLVRVASIIVVVCVPGISWPIKIGLCLVATIIPYVAVVRANGGPVQERDPTNLLVGPPPREQLGAAGRGLPAPDAREDFIRADYVVKHEESATARGADPAASPQDPESAAGPGAGAAPSAGSQDSTTQGPEKQDSTKHRPAAPHSAA